MTGATCRQIVGALILVVTTGEARADTIEGKMEKLGFLPADVTAHVADTIEWVNPISWHIQPPPEWFLTSVPVNAKRA